MSLYATLDMIIDLNKQLEERTEILEQKLELLAVKKKILKKRFPGRENISEREDLTKKLEEILDVGFATN